MTKTGLVIEGGATRGIYAAGVLDVFNEKGITFDGVIGVSAGAVHGCSYVACQPGRSIRYYLAYVRDPRFMGVRSLITTGSYVGTRFCYHDVPERLCPLDHEAFEASPTRFYVTCTDVETGLPWYRETPTLRGEGIDALRASASLPIVSRVVEVDGRKVLDGGTADSIPLVAFQKMGYDRCVVIQTRPLGYRKPASDPILARWLYRQYPDYLLSIKTRHVRYNRALEEIRRQELCDRIVAVRPSVLTGVTHLDRDPKRILEMYELGRRDAFAKLDVIRKFLEK